MLVVAVRALRLWPRFRLRILGLGMGIRGVFILVFVRAIFIFFFLAFELFFRFSPTHMTVPVLEKWIVPLRFSLLLRLFGKFLRSALGDSRRLSFICFLCKIVCRFPIVELEPCGQLYITRHFGHFANHLQCVPLSVGNVCCWELVDRELLSGDLT